MPLQSLPNRRGGFCFVLAALTDPPPPSDALSNRHGLAMPTDLAALDRILPGITALGLDPPARIMPPGFSGRRGRGAGSASSNATAWTATSETPVRPRRGDLTVDPATGSILTRRNFADKHLVDRIAGYGIPIHGGHSSPRAMMAWIATGTNGGREPDFTGLSFRSPRSAYLLEPCRKLLRRDRAGSKRQCVHDGLFLGRRKPDAVGFEEERCCEQPAPFVAVDERVVLHDAVGVCGGHVEHRRLLIREEVLRTRESGCEEPSISHAAPSAEPCEQFVMERQAIFFADPDRFVHRTAPSLGEFVEGVAVSLDEVVGDRRLFRKAGALGRQPHGAFGGLREEESVPFSDVQQSQRLGWDDDPEGVADTANLQFQRHVITIGITGGVVKETIAR